MEIHSCSLYYACAHTHTQTPTHYFYGFPAKNASLESNHEEISDKLSLRKALSTQLVFSRHYHERKKELL